MVLKTLILFFIVSIPIFSQDVIITSITLASNLKNNQGFKTLLIEVKGPYKLLSEASEMELQFAEGGYTLFDRILFYNHSFGIAILKARIYEGDNNKFVEIINNPKKAVLEIVKTE